MRDLAANGARNMSNFEFVFSLLAIILGLGLADVFGGLARAVKARPKVRIGWATGLLALWTIMRTALFWRLIWRTRDKFPDSSVPCWAAYSFAASIILQVLSCSRMNFRAEPTSMDISCKRKRKPSARCSPRRHWRTRFVLQ